MRSATSLFWTNASMNGKREVLVALLVLFSAASSRAQDLEYNRDIRPILSDNCFACHGPDKNKREAELRLDIREVALEKKAIAEKKAAEKQAALQKSAPSSVKPLSLIHI